MGEPRPARHAFVDSVEVQEWIESTLRARLCAAARGHSVPMPAKGFVVRFPNGDFEYDVRRAPAPEVGDTIRRKGALWNVTRVTGTELRTIHVEAKVDDGR